MAEVAGHLGWLNAGLGVFNLLPGAPLDGGRLVRAVTWRITGDRLRATRVAARCGQLLGGVLVTLGLAQVFFVPGAFVGGLWQAFIGWFLAQAATAELVAAKARWLGDVAAGAVAFPWVEPGGQRDRGRGGRRVVPAAGCRCGARHRRRRLVGVVRAGDVAPIPPRRRARVRVADIKRPVVGEPVAASAPAAELPALVGDAAFVTDDGRVRVVIPERLERIIRRRARLKRGRRW